jgi:hypothetical protein
MSINRIFWISFVLSVRVFSMNKHVILILTSIFIVIVLNSCSSRQDVYISNTGEGTILLDINLDDMVVQYSRDLLGGFSNTETEEIILFDTHKISYIVSALESVSLTDISSDSPDMLHLELDFQDPGNILNAPESPGTPDVISFSRRNSGDVVIKQLKLYLSQKNFNTVTALVGMKDSEVMDTFGPQENPYSESEYLDLMEFLFEEYESSWKIRSILKSSEIIINLQVDGKIVECSGCTGSGSSAEIRIPLLEIVTLVEPIEVVVEWK